MDLGVLYFGKGVVNERNVPDGGWAEGKRIRHKPPLSAYEESDVESLKYGRYVSVTPRMTIGKKSGIPSHVRVVQQNMRFDVKRAIDRLGEIEKRVIRMLFFDGYTRDEIAERLSRSQAWVSKMALPSALGHLKANLHPYENWAGHVSLRYGCN